MYYVSKIVDLNGNKEIFFKRVIQGLSNICVTVSNTENKDIMELYSGKDFRKCFDKYSPVGLDYYYAELYITSMSILGAQLYNILSKPEYINTDKFDYNYKSFTELFKYRVENTKLPYNITVKSISIKIQYLMDYRCSTREPIYSIYQLFCNKYFSSIYLGVRDNGTHELVFKFNSRVCVIRIKDKNAFKKLLPKVAFFERDFNQYQ